MVRPAAERVEERRRQFEAGTPVTPHADALAAFFEGESFSPVISTDGRAIVLDLGADSPHFAGNTANVDVTTLGALIDAEMSRQDTGFAFGRWGEHRALYDNEHFSAGQEDSRTIHMGVDLFCAPLTEVRAPFAGVVEFVANNARELDYGPMIVLRHASRDGHEFFTLYGHLDLASVRRLQRGQAVAAGDVIAVIGAPPENGNWPPHLHFQLILDLLGLGADFPGVASAAQQDFWLALSPNPACFFAGFDSVTLDARRAED